MWKRLFLPTALILALTEVTPIKVGNVFYVPKRDFYFKGQRGLNPKVTWSNDEILAEMGRPLNPPNGYPRPSTDSEKSHKKRRSALASIGQKVRRSADPNPAPQGGRGGTGRWYKKSEGPGATVHWSNDQHLIDMGRTKNPPGWIEEYMENGGMKERQERKGKKNKNLHR